MHLVLINPWIHDFSAFDFWLKPVGLISLASSLKNAGFKVSYIDLLDPFYLSVYNKEAFARLKRLPDGRGKIYSEEIPKPDALKNVPRRFKRYGLPKAIAKKLFSELEPPDAILIGTMMTYWYTGVKETIEFMRELFSKTPIIVGGLYVSILPLHSRKSLGADYFVCGDYEIHLPEVLKKISGSEVKLPAPEEVCLVFEGYNRLDYGCIITARGCPFHCSYCISSKLHPEIKRKPIELVLEELERLEKDFQVDQIAFYDDALIVDSKNHLMPLLEEIIKRGMKFQFHTPNGLHLKGLTKELALLMKRAGFVNLRFGLETTNMERAKELGPKAYWDDLLKALEILNLAGFAKEDICVYLLVGLPGQEPEEIEEDIKRVKKLGIKISLSEYSPIPGTELFNKAKEYARFDIENEPLFHNNSLLSTASPTLSTETLSRLKALARS